MQENLLQIKNLSKHFPGVTALDNVSFDISRNSVHCIVGENGAGKSTLIKILTGAERKSKGQIFFSGREFNPKNTRDAMNSGMSVLFQELNVVDQLTVEENLSLGKEKKRAGFIQKDTQVIDRVFDVMHSLDPTISIHHRVADLSVAQKQVIEIAKAIASDSHVIIMDEPTAALSEDEVHRLFSIIAKLKEQNVTVVYISHRLQEIFQIGDYVTVLRDGQMIGTRSIEELTGCRDEVESCAELIKMMLGKVVVEHYIPSTIDRETVYLELKNVHTDKLRNINFKLYKGEILGFYGLIGAGKTEIAKAVYGVDEKEGSVIINGAVQAIENPLDAIAMGISMVPEERRSEGLFTKLAIRENVPIMNLRSISKNGIFSRKMERELARRYIEDLRIVARDENQIVSKLSGGNQQKVVLSKCLNAGSNILMMDEPTRGIDVGAKEEIHNLIRKLSEDGKSIIVFSSELPEILNLCDRILLLFEGEIVKEITNGGEVDSEEIMHIVTGGVKR
jgi:ABC-type sugar transport system ATPase subunit